MWIRESVLEDLGTSAYVSFYHLKLYPTASLKNFKQESYLSLKYIDVVAKNLRHLTMKYQLH